MSTDLIEQPATGELTPMQLLSTAVANGVDTDKLKQLMDLQREWQADRAREAFNKAMSEAQEEMPAVVADAENSHTGSRYAKIEAINKQIAPIYTKHGFALSFGTSHIEKENTYSIYCDCRHKAGHVERYTGDFPADGVGAKGASNKTPIQAMGSTISYGRRYLTMMIFNLAVTGEDNDGNAPVQCITPEQIEAINTLLDQTLPEDDKLSEVLKFAEVESLDLVKANLFPLIVNKLRKTVEAYNQ